MTLPGADEVQLRARYLGTGNADTTTKYVFLTNQHRDTAASIVSHTSSQCAYYAVAQNESIHRTKYNLLESMIQPCGLPPHLQQQQQQQKQSNQTGGTNTTTTTTTTSGNITLQLSSNTATP
jgi:splicing factor 3B subunit 5